MDQPRTSARTLNPEAGEHVISAHPGEQVMELLADSSTGSRVALAVSAALATPRPSEVRGNFPPVTFLVRVEQWNGAQQSRMASSFGGPKVNLAPGSPCMPMNMRC